MLQWRNRWNPSLNLCRLRRRSLLTEIRTCQLVCARCFGCGAVVIFTSSTTGQPRRRLNNVIGQQPLLCIQLSSDLGYFTAALPQSRLLALSGRYCRAAAGGCVNKKRRVWIVMRSFAAGISGDIGIFLPSLSAQSGSLPSSVR